MIGKHLGDILGPVTRINRGSGNIQGSLGEMGHSFESFSKGKLIFTF